MAFRIGRVWRVRCMRCDTNVNWFDGNEKCCFGKFAKEKETKWRAFEPNLSCCRTQHIAYPKWHIVRNFSHNRLRQPTSLFLAFCDKNSASGKKNPRKPFWWMMFACSKFERKVQILSFSHWSKTKTLFFDAHHCLTTIELTLSSKCHFRWVYFVFFVPPSLSLSLSLSLSMCVFSSLASSSLFSGADCWFTQRIVCVCCDIDGFVTNVCLSSDRLIPESIESQWFVKFWVDWSSIRVRHEIKVRQIWATDAR